MVVVQAFMIYLIGLLMYFIAMAMEGKNSVFAQLIATAVYLSLITLCAGPICDWFISVADHPLTRFLLRYPTRDL